MAAKVLNSTKLISGTIPMNNLSFTRIQTNTVDPLGPDIYILKCGQAVPDMYIYIIYMYTIRCHEDVCHIK